MLGERALKTLGSRVEAARKKKGMTQEELPNLVFNIVKSSFSLCFCLLYFPFRCVYISVLIHL